MRADEAAVVTTIIDLTHDGVGVADLDGRRVFVADALPGRARRDRVLRKRRRKLQEADLKRVLEPSPERVHARVRVLRPLRRLRAAASRASRAGLVQAAGRRRDVEADRARRARGVAAGRRQPTVALSAPCPARREVRRRQEPRARRLSRARGARTSPTCAHCPVLMPPVDGLLGELAELIETQQRQGAAAADRSGRGGRRRRARVARARRAERRRQRGVSRLRRPPRHRHLLAARRARHDRAARSCAAAALSLAGVRPHARVLADGLRAGQRRRQRRARVDGRSLGRASSRRTACSICIAGSAISACRSRSARRELLGVEGEAGLVARAVRNAAANGIGNARFVTADLTASDWSFYRERWDVVVLDPPRTGAEAPVAEMHLVPAAPHRLRIVSPGDARARRASARRAAWV